MKSKHDEIPEEIKDRLAQAGARLVIKYGVQHDDLVAFILDIIAITDDYYKTETKETVN